MTDKPGTKPAASTEQEDAEDRLNIEDLKTPEGASGNVKGGSKYYCQAPR